MRFLEDILDIYGVNVHEWTICAIADNCSTNQLIANIMDVLQVSCASHRSHLEVKKMINNDRRLSEIIESIHETMRSCKSRLKNRAVLFN